MIGARHDGHHLRVLHPVVHDAFDEHGRGDHVQGAPREEHWCLQGRRHRPWRRQERGKRLDLAWPVRSAVSRAPATHGVSRGAEAIYVDAPVEFGGRIRVLHLKPGEAVAQVVSQGHGGGDGIPH